MQKKLLLLSLLFVVSSLFAFSENALKIHTKTGNDITFLCRKLPVITFSDKDIIVKTYMNEIHYSSAEVTKFTYINVDVSGIDGIKQNGALFIFEENVIKAFNLFPHTKVSLYTIEGKLVALGTTDDKGCISIQLNTITDTVYILKSESITFKIYKR